MGAVMKSMKGLFIAVGAINSPFILQFLEPLELYPG